MASSSSAGPSQEPTGATPQWRQFSFFDSEEVKDADDLSSSPRALRDLRLPIALATTSPKSPLAPSVLISAGQTITLLDRHFQPIRTWKAWEGNGRGIFLIEAGGLLLAIGDEDGSPFPVLKIWDLTRDEKKKPGGPLLLRHTRIQHGQRPHPVSALALTSNLSHLAIGLGDGTVLLYRHLLQSLSASPTALTSLPKARIVHESHEPVTGLGFREPTSASGGTASKAPESDKPNSSEISLFIVTVNRVLSAPVSGKGSARTIDELGAGLGCSAMDWDRREMIVARDEAIYLYGPEGRGACYAYEGQKVSIAVYKHNLLIISPPFAPSAGSNSATVRQYVSKSSNGESSTNIAKLTIFDLSNKIISHSSTFRDGIRDVFSQWGGIFVYGGDSSVSRLDEQSTSAKLDVLYRRNLYTLAISLARASGMNEAGIAGIHQKYGDYLYSKGDFDGAMGQFVKTLGSLQPSYVIRKFLDAQRIHNLTTYLQELHSSGLAYPDHTTLLLNCYTKTGDRTRLDSFIKTEAKRSEAGNTGELPFDLDTAIRVCRQAGFYEHATYLARKYGRHEDFLRIQIEDAEEYEDALKYLRSLGPRACEDNMLIYGRVLLNHVPDATTDILIDLCSGTLGRKPPPGYAVPDSGKAANGNGSSGPAMLSYLGYNRVAGMFSSDGASTPEPPVAKSDGEKGAATANGDTKSRVSQPDQPEPKASLDVDEGPTYIPPSPRIYFAHFLDHQPQFIRFLESVAGLLWGQTVPPPPGPRIEPLEPREDTGSMTPVDDTAKDQRSVWNTLLELFLAPSSAGGGLDEASKRKALGLLHSELPFDPMHAMVLCSSADFTEGLVGLWERMGMYEDILRFYIANQENPGASKEVVRYLKLYGPSNPGLYPMILRFLTSSPEILGRHSDDLSGILSAIDEQRIMPPLAVVQLLSRNGVTSVGSVKGWLREKVAEGRQEVESDKSLVQSYRSETATKQKEIVSLANPRQPEVFQVTRCASCGGQLDLPSVHFMCKHSYHQRCLSDSDPECILCARQHSVIREIRRNQTRLADRHELFLSEVHEAEDGFGIVAGAFGRGLMTKKVENQV